MTSLKYRVAKKTIHIYKKKCDNKASLQEIIEYNEILKYNNIDESVIAKIVKRYGYTKLAAWDLEFWYLSKNKLNILKIAAVCLILIYFIASNFICNIFKRRR